MTCTDWNLTDPGDAEPPEPRENHEDEMDHLRALNAELVEALSAICRFWAYGLNKPAGAEPTADDLKEVERLAALANAVLAKAEAA